MFDKRIVTVLPSSEILLAEKACRVIWAVRGWGEVEPSSRELYECNLVFVRAS